MRPCQESVWRESLLPFSLRAVIARVHAGVFNSWGRNQYLTRVRTGEPSIIPAENLFQHNFIISNFSSIFPFDHDDGSAYYHDDSNFLVYAPAKNLFGVSHC